MASFTYEGDLQGARKPQLDYISGVLQKLGYKGSKVTVEPVGKAGDNYMANVKRFTIKENGEALKLVAKLAPENPALREAANMSQCFRNEHIMYTEVLPKFNQKQITADVPENERFKFAKCYGSFSEAPNEVILLEDLKEHNFEILNRFEPFSYENVKLVLRNFAIYHALSYAIRYQEPEIFAHFQKQLAPNLIIPINEQLDAYMAMLESQALEHTEARCEKVIKGSVSKFTRLESKIRQLARNSKYTVIQQGDAWTNNIMFRHENNVAVECLLVDYQMVRENSPVYDLMYMLFNSTTHAHRSQYFTEYIDYYHNKLDNALHNFGLKANFVYPRDRLDADLKIYGKLMFAQSIIISSIVTKKTADAEKMKELMELKDINDEALALDIMRINDKETQHMFKIRIEGLVDSFSRFGLL